MDTKHAKRLLGLLAVVSVLAGLVEANFHILHNLLGGGPADNRELATRFLGEHLAGHYSGKKAVILSNPFSVQPGQPRAIYQFEKAGLRGLRNGLGQKVQIEQVAYPELKPGLLQNPHAAIIDPRTTTPLSYMVSDDALDRIVRQYPDVTILISLIGLPVKVQQTECWRAGTNRMFALLLPDLRMLGDQSAIRQSFQSGKLAAIVLKKPGAPPEDQPLGKDATLEFERRFLLVTPGNVDRYLRIYPRLF